MHNAQCTITIGINFKHHIMKIKNLFRAGAMAVAVAALGMSVGGCGNGGQLNASAAREQVVKLAETMVPAPAAHKDAVRVEAAVVKSFLEYNIIFADAKAYAGNDQSLLTVRYFEPLKAQYRAMGDMAPSVVEMLQGMGIDGVRIQYSAENSDKTIKQAFPWREISK